LTAAAEPNGHGAWSADLPRGTRQREASSHGRKRGARPRRRAAVAGQPPPPPPLTALACRPPPCPVPRGASYARVVRRRGGRPPARPPPHRLGTQPTCLGGVSCAGGAGRRAPPLSTPSEGRCRRPLCAAASRVPAPAASHDSATRLSARGGATPRPPPLGPPLACADAPDLAVNPTGAPPPAVGPGPPPTSVCPSGVRVGGPPGRGAPPGRPLAPAGRAASGGGWAHPRRIVYLRIMTQRGPSSPVGHRDRASIGGFDPIEPARRHPLSMGLGPSTEKATYGVNMREKVAVAPRGSSAAGRWRFFESEIRCGRNQSGG